MKAPDKIYAAFMNGQPIGISVHKLISLPHAYLRKDALLEWAKEELSKASVSSDSIGRRNAFIDVVDKLNSM